MSEETAKQELAKAYEPANIEGKWYTEWKGQGVFHAEPDPNKPPYCICIPPPNITGSLHMGHALNNTILDAMTRWHRMRGYSALCLPGTDHAGIATQNVVEKNLALEGLTRHDLGREKFIERCWQWREQYGTRIYHQFEKLGCSYDWERVRFTMDESYVNAIMEEFKSWYERGLIYRGSRVVNWDVKFQSAVSDIEVETKEVRGKLYHFRYPFVDGSGHITDRHDTSGNTARRYSGGGKSERCTVSAFVRENAESAAHGSGNPVDCRRVRQNGIRFRRGQGDTGARPERFRGGPAE